jgi:hypothetical protein
MHGCEVPTLLLLLLVVLPRVSPSAVCAGSFCCLLPAAALAVCWTLGS